MYWFASSGYCCWYLSPDGGPFIPGQQWSAATVSSGHTQWTRTCILFPTIQVSPCCAELLSRTEIPFWFHRNHHKLSGRHFLNSWSRNFHDQSRLLPIGFRSCLFQSWLYLVLYVSTWPSVALHFGMVEGLTICFSFYNRVIFRTSGF